MNPKSEGVKRSEMKATWNSYEWYLKDKLISLDNNVRAMILEMKAVGVPERIIVDFLPEAFDRLKQEVVREQDERYHRKGAGA